MILRFGFHKYTSAITVNPHGASAGKAPYKGLSERLA